MTTTSRKSRGFAVLMIVLIALIVIGVALMIFGSRMNGMIAPVMPGSSPLTAGGLHG